MNEARIRHFLEIDQIPAGDLRAILSEARDRKCSRGGAPSGLPDAGSPLSGHTLAMLFEQPSTRTRVSFDLSIRQLGGGSLILNFTETQLGRGESIADTARVLSRYVDAVMIRTGDYRRLTEFAAHSGVPVINGLTNRTHPCQVLGDILTFEERLGSIEGRSLAWCGDGNNVSNSFVQASAKFGFRFSLACPEGHGPDAGILEDARACGADIRLEADPFEAVAGADCVMTDTWSSMGAGAWEGDLALFGPYQVNRALMNSAAPGAIFLHCLPAYRGREVTDEVIDGPESAVFEQAENRLHVQKAILVWCLAKTHGAE